jgi:hypothetical protein
MEESEGSMAGSTIRLPSHWINVEHDDVCILPEQNTKSL